MNYRNRIITAALVLALVTLACGLIKPPVTEIKTGTMQGGEIQVPMPKDTASGVELNLEFVAGDLKLAPLAPGTNGLLVSGKATFNVADFEPKIESSGSSATLRTGDMEIKGIPVVKGELKNEWDLQLADTPMSLKIQAGAYNGKFELGGLSLKKLAISEGGSDLTGAFTEPNHVEMSSLTFDTGGSKVTLTGLANANFAQMSFKSGAGDYTLSFDGELKRDASVMIDSGLGSVTIIVPEGTNAQLNLDSGLASVNKTGGWEQMGNAYTLSGSGPTLTITVIMGAGTLNLKTE